LYQYDLTQDGKQVLIVYEGRVGLRQMENQHGEPRRIPPFVLVSGVVLVFLGLAFFGHQAAVNQTVERMYTSILNSPTPTPENYPTEAARLERCEKLLRVWRAFDKPTLDFEELGADLSLPLRVTRTFSADNPESLRKQAGVVFARNLAALCGRKAAAATPAAWAVEIEAWRKTVQPITP
jgi:hypothetical protein